MPARNLTVIETSRPTPHMIRVILAGQDLADFPEDQESGYVKVVVERDDKPVMRSYTIRAFDKQQRHLTLDFVDHGDAGPASAWANRAAPGTALAIHGPGPTKLVDTNSDWFLLAGDMTALPAIAVNLEKLPESARGYAVIEVVSEADIQNLQAPAGIDVHWVVNPHPDRPNQLLAERVLALPWHQGTPGIWLACEFDTMRNLRRYFRSDRQVPKQSMYASSYWKMNASDEDHKAAKSGDSEADI